MGRSGRLWGCDHEEVVPDLLVVSKGLAATPVAAAAANATLDVLEGEGLVARAAGTGAYFRERLVELQERHPILGWIDARGLFVGLEFVRDRRTKEPAAEEAGWMLDHCVREGLLFEKGGYLYNRFQLIPPLTIERSEIDRAVAILEGAMSMAEARSGIARPVSVPVTAMAGGGAEPEPPPPGS